MNRRINCNLITPPLSPDEASSAEQPPHLQKPGFESEEQEKMVPQQNPSTVHLEGNNESKFRSAPWMVFGTILILVGRI